MLSRAHVQLTHTASGAIGMKPKKPLTDRAIRALQPALEGKRRIVWDAIVPGLGIRVTDRGVKTFVLVTRYPGSTSPAPRSLGVYGGITLEAARAKARAWLELIASGIDPEQHAARKREQTFQAISDQYFLRKAKDHRSRALSEATLARLVYPTFGPGQSNLEHHQPGHELPCQP
jgi:hypothetical protein